MMIGLVTASCQKWPPALPSLRHPPQINPQQNLGFARGSHFAEIIVWAVFYRQMGMLASVQEAMFYSMEYYTTLAVNVQKLPGHWAGFGGFEAMTGMLMFGWSTAVLAVVVQKMHSIDE